ncbi:hypothetical protein HLRTI_002492 [Halorhabdus tiamatea SARL4B]|uniref:Uncharacterized protein n=1 Tax=Halorhabdus tiamatea SARL4B TaxID=1033806 RepID=U2FAR8_9EURY|nr:hypothetical protein [Halorhabdus tiamatea]ERJ05514.1 hypothetical protein HLRTI_002492 [Halorhabdus tiamatea SARL4B]
MSLLGNPCVNYSLLHWVVYDTKKYNYLWYSYEYVVKMSDGKMQSGNAAGKDILTNRRRFLQSVTTVGAGVPVAVSAVKSTQAKEKNNKKGKKTLEQAKKIRRNAGEKAVHNFLKNKQISFAGNTYGFKFDDDEMGGGK